MRGQRNATILKLAEKEKFVSAFSYVLKKTFIQEISCLSRARSDDKEIRPKSVNNVRHACVEKCFAY